MAMMIEPQQQSHKHHCRICKKAFECGRALGGHMRAHVINEDPMGDQGDGADDEPSACGSGWDDKSSPPAGHWHRYALCTNPNRLRTCLPCENWGKEFSSWKAFLQHGNGRCASAGEVDAGEEYSMVSSPRSDGAGAEDDDPVQRRGCMGWSKGKQTRRTKVAAAAFGASSSYCLSSQEEDLANCLVMLSAGCVDLMVAVETEESCASASKEEDHRNPASTTRS